MPEALCGALLVALIGLQNLAVLAEDQPLPAKPGAAALHRNEREAVEAALGGVDLEQLYADYLERGSRIGFARFASQRAEKQRNLGTSMIVFGVLAAGGSSALYFGAATREDSSRSGFFASGVLALGIGLFCIVDGAVNIRIGRQSQERLAALQ